MLPQRDISEFIKTATQKTYVDASDVDRYRKEGEKTLEKGRERRYKRACDKREITPFGPTRAIALVEEYGATLIHICKISHGRSGTKLDHNPIFTKGFADRLSQRVFGEGAGIGVDNWPLNPRPHSRLLPETYDARMLLELVRVEKTYRK